MFARGFVGWGKPGATEYGVPPLARLRRVSLRQNCSIESPDFVAVHESAYGRKADIAPTGLLAYVLTEALQFDVSGGKIMAQKLSGGCACGAIHYECSADPVLMLNCHCRDCQQASGSAYAAIVVVSKTALQIRGEPRYHKVRADGHASFRNGWFYPGDRGSRMSCLLLCRSPPFPDAESQSKDVKEAARVLATGPCHQRQQRRRSRYRLYDLGTAARWRLACHRRSLPQQSPRSTCRARRATQNSNDVL